MIHFKLVSLNGTEFEGDVYEVVLPTLEGEIGVLKDHMPLVSVVSNGVISVRKQQKDADRDREYFATSGGLIEISNNTLRVLVDDADSADELNEAEIKKALDLAQKMQKEAKDQVSLEHAQQLVDRQQVRLQVAGLKRRTNRK